MTDPKRLTHREQLVTAAKEQLCDAKVLEWDRQHLVRKGVLNKESRWNRDIETILLRFKAFAQSIVDADGRLNDASPRTLKEALENNHEQMERIKSVLSTLRRSHKNIARHPDLYEEHYG